MRTFTPKQTLPPKQAFTLIELLTVVAVIAVLAMILVPVINSSRQSSLRVHSLSNLKSIGHGIILYAQENDGDLPKLMDAWAPPFWTHAIEDYIAPSIRGGGWDPDASWVQSPTLVDALLPQNLHHSTSDYGVNNDLIREHDVRKLHAIPDPSRLVMAMTAREGFTQRQGSWFVAAPQYVQSPQSPYSRPDERGGSTILAVFCDGHTEAILKQDFENNRQRLLQTDFLTNM